MLRASATQRPAYPLSETESLPYDVERNLTLLFEKELHLIKEVEQLKSEVITRFDFSVKGMFNEIDDWNYKYIDIKNMKRFLTKTSVYAEEWLLKGVIRRLDADGDARLSLKEFTVAVSPIKS